MDDSHDMADDIDWMYGVGDRLQHVKTGRFYVVRTLAFDEATATPVYVYSLDSWSNQTEWVRAKDVMEDGRFVYAPKPTEAQKDAEIAQLRAENARLREAMPGDDVRDEINDASVMLHEDGGMPATLAWLARLDAAKEVR